MSPMNAIVPAGQGQQGSNRQAPFSQEAEEATIGAVLVNPEAFVGVASFLHAQDFYILRHIYIWEALESLSERDGVDIDYLTLQEELRGMGKLNECGGPAYLIQLINNTPTSMHAEVYGRLVERAAVRRRLIQAGLEIVELGMDESTDTDIAVVESYQRIESVRRQQEKITLLPGSMSIQHYDHVLTEIEDRIKAGEMVSYPTPESWGVLHNSVPMTFPGDYMVISGPPGSGKSAMCECWGEDLAGKGVKCLYIHTEMSTADMLHRRMSRHSGLAFDVLKASSFRAGKVTVTGEWQSGDYDRVIRADQQIARFADNLSYLHAPDPDFKSLALLMRQAAMAGVEAIFLDHFQDVKMPFERGQNPIMAYENAVSWLAAFAELRGVHLVIASQETNGHVKWSKKLVEKALMWMSISRPKLKSEQGYWLNGNQYQSLVGEYTPFPDVFVHKARFGKTGKRPAFYHGPQFQWLDRRDVQTQKPAGKIVAFGQIPLNAAAEV